MGDDPLPSPARALRRRVFASAGVLWLGLALLASTGCRRVRPLPVVYDLAARAVVADWHGAWDRVAFGTPAAEQIQENGFVRVEGKGASAATGILARATIPLIFGKPEPRLGVLEAAAEPAFVGATLDVAVNRSTVGRFVIGARRQRFRFEIPVSIQRPGRNRIRFRFPAEEARRKDPFAGAPVARLFRLAVGPAGPALEALAATGAPRPGPTTGTPPGLVQAGPSRLRFALIVPEAAELRVRAGLDRRVPRGVTVPLRIALAGAKGPEQELWAKTLRSGDAPEQVRVPLPGPAGRAASVLLEVGSASDGRSAWALWAGPRVVARRSADPLAVAAEDPAARAAADRLRRSLAGMNVVLVIFDAAQAHHFGCYGYPHPTTPVVDRLAREGVLFENHYTPAVFTYAAIGTLWTSRYPDEGQRAWIHYGKLPADRPTLAERLSAAGIETASFVANPSAGPGFDLTRGFHEFFGLYRPPWLAPGEMSTADVFRRHLHPWLAEHRSQRFFAYAHFREPHGPLTQPPLWGPDAPLPPEARNYGWFRGGRRPLSPAERDHLVRLYDGNLHYGDHEVGALRRKLEELGLWEKTVLILTADHGDSLDEHGHIGHNHWVYQETAHIPLVMHFPKAAGVAGRKVAGLTSLMDLAPTVADIMGLAPSATRSFRGRSLLPVIEGAPGDPGVVVRTTGYVYGLVSGGWKYIENARNGDHELYHLAADPGETRDLAQEEPVRAAAYQHALDLWLTEMHGTPGAQATHATLDEKDKEVLRALGYVNNN